MNKIEFRHHLLRLFFLLPLLYWTLFLDYLTGGGATIVFLLWWGRRLYRILREKEEEEMKEPSWRSKVRSAVPLIFIASILLMGYSAAAGIGFVIATIAWLISHEKGEEEAGEEAGGEVSEGGRKIPKSKFFMLWRFITLRWIFLIQFMFFHSRRIEGGKFKQKWFFGDPSSGKEKHEFTLGEIELTDDYSFVANLLRLVKLPVWKSITIARGGTDKPATVVLGVPAKWSFPEIEKEE